MSFTPEPRPKSNGEPMPDEPPKQRLIGHLIRELRSLSDEEFERILVYQRSRGTRFGEAAVALNLATKDDVIWALSQQFHYPYAFAGGSAFSTELAMAVDPFGPQAEAFREMRSQLVLDALSGQGPRRALAVLSASDGEGKSYFAANMAIALSQLGGRTLLIDGDMRRPRQHSLFGIDAHNGLSNVLAGHCELDLGSPSRGGPVSWVDSRNNPRAPIEGTATAVASFPVAEGICDTGVVRSIQHLPGLYVLPVGTLP
ncbi:MAG: hypothetical protein K2X36_00195, partial [Microbacteriaceae bacterium]|nr:hypothetical protein [Microbacteriaceae bacterium]